MGRPKSVRKISIVVKTYIKKQTLTVHKCLDIDDARSFRNVERVRNDIKM